MKILPVYVALDIDSEEQALVLAKQTASYVMGFKIGPRLILKSSSTFIEKLKALDKKVFLDCKFFDIPNTMLASVQAAFDRGVDLVTIHAQAGESALRQLSQLERQLKIKRDFRILAVTVLTSFSQRELPASTRCFSISRQVEWLADMVIRSGLSGLVCSGHEARFLRNRYPHSYLVTPGIRFSDCVQTDSSDQNRIMTPVQALKAGVSAMVIGRPIYESSHPEQVCSELQKSLQAVSF